MTKVGYPIAHAPNHPPSAPIESSYGPTNFFRMNQNIQPRPKAWFVPREADRRKMHAPTRAQSERAGSERRPSATIRTALVFVLAGCVSLACSGSGRAAGAETGRWPSLQQRLVKTGAGLTKHARYYWLLLDESHLTRRLFAGMLRKIAALPSPAG